METILNYPDEYGDANALGIGIEKTGGSAMKQETAWENRRENRGEAIDHGGGKL